jgi:hypothetical protein
MTAFLRHEKDTVQETLSETMMKEVHLDGVIIPWERNHLKKWEMLHFSLQYFVLFQESINFFLKR